MKRISSPAPFEPAASAAPRKPTARSALAAWATRPVVPALAAALAGAPAPALADDEWRLAIAPFSLHWRYSAEHKQPRAIALERQRKDGTLWGASFFVNSFGQDSSYYYLGERHPGIAGMPQLFAQWSAGLLYGYRGKYEDKVPLNRRGFAPGALISLGWTFGRDTSGLVHLVGDAGLMLQLNYALR